MCTSSIPPAPDPTSGNRLGRDRLSTDPVVDSVAEPTGSGVRSRRVERVTPVTQSQTGSLATGADPVKAIRPSEIDWRQEEVNRAYGDLCQCKKALARRDTGFCEMCTELRKRFNA